MLAKLLEPTLPLHEHGGVCVSISEVFALSERFEGGALSRQNLAECLEHEKTPVSRLTAGMDCGAG